MWIPERTGSVRRKISDRSRHPAAFAMGTGTVLEVLKRHPVDRTWEYLVRIDDGRIVSWNRVDAVGGR